MFYIFAVIATIITVYLTKKDPRYGVGLLLVLLPTYNTRFLIGPLPTTIFEVIVLSWMGTIFYQKAYRKKIVPLIKQLWQQKIFFIAASLFLVGATIGIFFSSSIRSALGEWKAFYIEPALFFFFWVLLFQEKKEPVTLFGKEMSFVSFSLGALLACGIGTAAYAILQRFTGWGVPHSFWANRNTFRVTAWYGFPNGVGLFLGMIFPLFLYAIQAFKKYRNPMFFMTVATMAIVLAIIFAKSTGALVGIVGGIGILLLCYKKTRIPAIILGVFGIVMLAVLPATNPIKVELLAQDRSGQIRRAMWSEAIELLHDHPIVGAGLASYDKKIVPYHKTVNGEGIEIFHLPHNIVLSIYVNTGIIGLIGFLLLHVWAMVSLLRIIWKKPTAEAQTVAIYLLSTFVCISIMGLVDTPYIRNDNAIVSWFLIALVYIYWYETRHSYSRHKELTQGK